MRLIEINEGALELKWTWLPYWMASNGRLRSEVEREIRDSVLLNAVTTSELDLQALHAFTLNLLKKRFAHVPAAAAVLEAIAQAG